MMSKRMKGIVAVAVFGAHPGTIGVVAGAGGVTQGARMAANATAAATGSSVIGVALCDAAAGEVFELAHMPAMAT